MLSYLKSLSFKAKLMLYLLSICALVAVFASKEPTTETQKVERFFSAWDGSHRELERAIKGTLNDPDSYEHVETRYINKGATIDLITQFRAKNGFGGTITKSATGTIDGRDGHLIDWKMGD